MWLNDNITTHCETPSGQKARAILQALVLSKSWNQGGVFKHILAMLIPAYTQHHTLSLVVQSQQINKSVDVLLLVKYRHSLKKKKKPPEKQKGQK